MDKKGVLMKRSQISVFIIIGLILLLVVALSIYVYDLGTNQVEPYIDNSLLIKSTTEPVKKYVENCIDQVSQEPVKTIGRNGGTLNPASFRWYDNQKYNYLCMNEQGACVPTLLLRQDMEKELQDAIRDSLSGCIDLTVFEKQGFDVKTGPMEVNVTIGLEHVNVRVDYPIELIKEGLDLTVSEFSDDIPEPLGMLYDKGIEIVNDENSRGYFDQVDYMYNNGDMIEVEKHRPYPDIIYTLTDGGYVFRFALQGDSSSSQGYRNYQAPDYGCCYNLYDKDCYKGVPESECRDRQGVYDFNPGCTCPETDDTMDTTCGGRPCGDCLHTYDPDTGNYDNKPRKSGESWCVYDGIAGKGYDYVGTRHYMHYCIDGVEYEEDCRDFREELCTEQTVYKGDQPFSKAICRVNRWEDCNDCTTEQCCEDTRFRDCSWKDWLNTNSKCVPYVPPGFRFWEAGSDICSFASQTKECSGLSCPNIWVDDTAVFCYMQGDCGNYRNIADKITYNGFFNSDFFDRPRSYVYLDNGLNRKANDYTINLGINNTEREALFTPPTVVQAYDNFILVMTTGLDYIDRVSSLSPSDFLNPFKSPDITILDAAVCDVWHAPYGADDCASCSNDPIHPCTEYMCRSLGQHCIYEESYGVGSCHAEQSDDRTPPEIIFDKSAVTKGYEAEEAELKISPKIYDGYEITPAIEPYRMMSLRINTTEDTVCRLRYLPRMEYIQSPSYYFGDSAFSMTHNISLRIPGRIKVPEKLKDFFNITNLGELMTMLERPKEFLDTYKSRYSAQIKMYDLISGGDIVSQVEPYADLVLRFINEFSDLVPFYKNLFSTILDNFDKGNYYFFVECTDRAGNTNSQEMFVRFSIEDSGNDTRPPIVLGFSPANGTMTIDSDKQAFSMYVNEPSECRFDYKDRIYDDMRFGMKCTSSGLNMNPRFGGSYLCTGDVNMTPETGIFIRCRDNPQEKHEYPLNIALGGEPGVSGNLESEYLNVSGQDIYAAARMLSSFVVFSVENRSARLHLYIDEHMNCSYSYNDIKRQFSPCMLNPKLELGLYECTQDIYLTGNETVLNNESFVLDLHREAGDNDMAGVDVTGSKLRINYTGQESFDVYLNRSSVQLELGLDDSYNCQDRNMEDNSTFAMTCSGKGNDTICYTQLLMGNAYEISCKEAAAPGFGVENITIECRVPNDAPRNTDVESTQYLIYRSPALDIVGKGPQSEVDTDSATLYVQTNNPSQCGYYRDLDLGSRLMDRLNSTYHEAVVHVDKGSQRYYFQCRDDYGNVVKDNVDFFVV